VIAEGVWERAVSDEPVTDGSDVHTEVSPSAPARVVIAVLGFYRRFISPALPRACRFYPTCSAYALAAVTRYGFLRGMGLAAVRLSKCHPLHKGGFDPVK